MSHYVDETYDAYVELEPIARTTHRCSACNEPIAPGDRYARISFVWEGSAQTVKRCVRCQAIHKHLRKLGDGEMWPDERLDCGEEYSQHWGKEPPPHIAELAFWRPGDPLPEAP